MLIDKKVKPNVLVIGDLILDKYVWGECSRISPEAPVQIIDITDESVTLGGAGNVVKNLLAFNSKVSIFSVLGNDEVAKSIKSILGELNINLSGIVTETGRLSSVKTRIISSHQQVIRFDKECKKNIKKSSEELLISYLLNEIKSFDIIILSDYAKGVLTQSLCQKIISISNRENIRVIVDPKGSNYKKYKGSYLLTPNKKEAFESTGIEIKDDKTLSESLLKLKNICDLKISLITLSEKGIAFFDTNFSQSPAMVRNVYDVTGAGDTVISALGYALGSGHSITDAVNFANLAAGVVVEKIGSATATIDEILAYYKNYSKPVINDKILNLDDLISQLNTHRKRGDKIVFTNGCFDILHSGHVLYLEEAKKQGDTLIVAINSDSSVMKLKGKNRPINSIEDRTKVLAALESINYVIIFDELTPEKVIKKIKPDILVKGGDYELDNVVGREYSKEVKLITFIDGKSSSNIINKIIANHGQQDN